MTSIASREEESVATPLLKLKKSPVITSSNAVKTTTSSTTPLTIEEVKEELSRICEKFRSGEIDADQVVRMVEKVLLVDGSPRVKQMQSILSKRVEATLGIHLCGLWRQCKVKCQYAGNLSKWKDEIKVYRPFGEAIPEMWTTRGLVSQAVRHAHDQSLESLRTRLSETEEELERAHSKRRRSDSDKVDREEAFKGLLAHMNFSTTEAPTSPTLIKLSSAGVLNDIIDGSSTTTKSSRRSSKFRPRVSPSVKAAAMLSLPPLLDIDDDEDDNEETESEQHKTKKDWPYRDVFPQFLRESSHEREGNLSAIMRHMKQIQRDETLVLEEEKKIVLKEKKSSNSVVVKVSSWFAVFALWLSKMSLRRKLFIAIAVFGIFSRLKLGRSVIASRSDRDRVGGIARLLPPGSIFRRLQEKSPVQANRVSGMARFLPPESIFSRLRNVK